MNTLPIHAIGYEALQRATYDAQRNARKIAAAVRQETRRPVEMVPPLLGLMQDRQQAQAAARIIKTGDEMMGTLLDVLA